MQYNPAFAGEADSPRFNTSFTLIASPKTNSFRDNDFHLYASYDQFLPKIRSGIGITAGYASRNFFYKGPYGSSFYSNTNTYLNVAVAPKFSLGGKLTLSPALDLTLRPGRISYDQPSRQDARGTSLQSRLGLLLNTRKFYVGYSVHLLTLRNTAIRTDTSSYRVTGRRGHFTSYWQMGYTFQRSSESKFSFTPQLVFQTGMDANYQYVRKFGLYDINLTMRYKKLICGVNSVGVHVGWQTDRMRIMLSDRLNYLSRDNPSYFGNISFRYLLKQRDR